MTTFRGSRGCEKLFCVWPTGSRNVFAAFQPALRRHRRHLSPQRTRPPTRIVLAKAVRLSKIATTATARNGFSEPFPKNNFTFNTFPEKPLLAVAVVAVATVTAARCSQLPAGGLQRCASPYGLRRLSQRAEAKPNLFKARCCVPVFSWRGEGLSCPIFGTPAVLAPTAASPLSAGAVFRSGARKSRRAGVTAVHLSEIATTATAKYGVFKPFPQEQLHCEHFSQNTSLAVAVVAVATVIVWCRSELCVGNSGVVPETAAAGRTQTVFAPQRQPQHSTPLHNSAMFASQRRGVT